MACFFLLSSREGKIICRVTRGSAARQQTAAQNISYRYLHLSRELMTWWARILELLWGSKAGGICVVNHSFSWSNWKWNPEKSESIPEALLMVSSGSHQQSWCLRSGLVPYSAWSVQGRARPIWKKSRGPFPSAIIYQYSNLIEERHHSQF